MTRDPSSTVRWNVLFSHGQFDRRIPEAMLHDSDPMNADHARHYLSDWSTQHPAENES